MLSIGEVCFPIRRNKVFDSLKAKMSGSMVHGSKKCATQNGEGGEGWNWEICGPLAFDRSWPMTVELYPLKGSLLILVDFFSQLTSSWFDSITPPLQFFLQQFHVQQTRFDAIYIPIQKWKPIFMFSIVLVYLCVGTLAT